MNLLESPVILLKFQSPDLGQSKVVPVGITSFGGEERCSGRFKESIEQYSSEGNDSSKFYLIFPVISPI